VVRRREVPVFCWVRLASDGGPAVDSTGIAQKQLLSRRKIILAQVEIFNCQLKQPVCVVHRCNARPDCGPHIGCGQASLDPLELQSFDLDEDTAPEDLVVIFQSTVISTTAAAFQTVPYYSANVQGERWLKMDSPAGAAGSFPIFAYEHVRIEKSYVDKFTASVLVFPLLTRRLEALIKNGNLQNVASQIADEVRKKWTLVWMGVER
jgi:hypothetical protein